MTTTNHLTPTELDGEPTPRAIGLCAKWLQCCLRVGWPKSSLDDLEQLWWRYHDRYGNLIAPEVEHD